MKRKHENICSPLAVSQISTKIAIAIAHSTRHRTITASWHIVTGFEQTWQKNIKSSKITSVEISESLKKDL